MNDCNKVTESLQKYKRKLGKKSNKVTKYKIRIGNLKKNRKLLSKKLKQLQEDMQQFKKQIENKQALNTLQSSYAKKESNRQQQQQITNVARKFKETEIARKNKGINQQQQKQKKINNYFQKGEMDKLKMQQLQKEGVLKANFNSKSRAKNAQIGQEKQKREFEQQLGKYRINMAGKRVSNEKAINKYFPNISTLTKTLSSSSIGTRTQLSFTQYSKIKNTLLCSLMNLGILSGLNNVKVNTDLTENQIKQVNIKYLTNDSKVKINFGKGNKLNIKESDKILIRINDNEYTALKYPLYYDSKYSDVIKIEIPFEKLMNDELDELTKFIVKKKPINS